MENDKPNENYNADAAMNLEFYVDLIRRSPEVFTYWRTCAACHTWFETLLTIDHDEAYGIYFCSTNCKQAYEEALWLLSLEGHSDECIINALNHAAGVPKEFIIHVLKKFRQE